MSTILQKINLKRYFLVDCESAESGGKKVDKKKVGILFLIGVLLIIISIPLPSKKTSNMNMEEQANHLSSNQTETPTNDYTAMEVNYKHTLETQLQDLLVNMQGAGKVQVMITLQATSQKVLEKDVSTSEGEIEQATVYSESDYGKIPYVNKELYPKVEGVVVIAEGGDHPVVIKNITEAIQALFEVDTHKIKIMKMKSIN